MSEKRIIHAPRGVERSCKGWHQEAAMRMLMNNLDPDVAEAPDRLVVYGGTGRAASLDREFKSRRTMEQLRGVQSARAHGPHHVRPNDCRVLDLHRQPGHCAGHIRD